MPSAAEHRGAAHMDALLRAMPEDVEALRPVLDGRETNQPAREQDALLRLHALEEDIDSVGYDHLAKMSRLDGDPAAVVEWLLLAQPKRRTLTANIGSRQPTKPSVQTTMNTPHW